LQGAVQVGEEFVQGLGLGHGAREAVEDEAPFGVRLGQALADDADDQLVGDQFAPFHDGLGLLPQGGAGGHRRAQQVTGGDLGDLVLFHQALGLGALAGSGGAHEGDAHGAAP